MGWRLLDKKKSACPPSYRNQRPEAGLRRRRSRFYINLITIDKIINLSFKNPLRTSFREMNQISGITSYTDQAGINREKADFWQAVNQDGMLDKLKKSP